MPHTGYTHQWRRIGSALAGLVMASVHTPEERTHARALGYRCFRVVRAVSDLLPGEILCPASTEAGARTTCERCTLCDGSRGPTDRRADIAIVAH